MHKPDAQEQIGGSAPAGVLHHHRRHVCGGGSDACAATLDSGDAALVRLPTLRALGCGRFRATRRFYHLCGKLAHKKQQLARLGDEGGTAQIIESLRTEMRRLAPEAKT